MPKQLETMYLACNSQTTEGFNEMLQHLQVIVDKSDSGFPHGRTSSRVLPLTPGEKHRRSNAHGMSNETRIRQKLSGTFEEPLLFLVRLKANKIAIAKVPLNCLPFELPLIQQAHISLVSHKREVGPSLQMVLQLIPCQLRGALHETPLALCRENALREGLIMGQ